jgi:hypothetical protein
MNRSYKSFKLLGQSSQTRALLFKEIPTTNLPKRHFSLIPIFSRVLRLRYLFLGTAVGGGIALKNVTELSKFYLIINSSHHLHSFKKYEDFKDSMPDISWMKQFMDEDTFERVANKMKNIYDMINPEQTVCIRF